MDSTSSWAISEHRGPKRSHTVIRARPATASSLLRGGRVEQGGPEFLPGGVNWGGGYLQKEVARKCEALAVYGLAEFGEALEIIAPIEIIKDLFKLPYSQAAISICIHRVGKTLVLSAGADLEGSSPAPEAPEVYDLPSSVASHLLCHTASGDGQISSSSLQNLLCSGHQAIDGDLANDEGLIFGSFDSASSGSSGAEAFWRTGRSEEGWNSRASRVGGFPASYDDGKALVGSPPSGLFLAGAAKSRSERQGESRLGNVARLAEVTIRARQNEEQGGPRDGSSKSARKGNKANVNYDGEAFEDDGDDYPFARVVIWHFDMWRMLLGSDLAVFSNKEHSAVSLHLVELRKESSPLLWLDVWLENVMAGVPEVAICYHHKDVVHGYELLRTDDISQIKALNRDGSSSFHPAVVEHCAATVLDFIRENCSKSPGTFLLTKQQGTGLLRLHDLTSHPGPKEMNKEHTKGAIIPNQPQARTLPLAMLMYRLAKRLARQQRAGDLHRSADFFHQALHFLDEEDHPGICSAAHEYIAQHCLNHGCVLQSNHPLFLEGPSAAEKNRAGEVQDVVDKEPFDRATVEAEDATEGLGNSEVLSQDAFPQPTASLFLSPVMGQHQQGPALGLLQQEDGSSKEGSDAGKDSCSETGSETPDCKVLGRGSPHASPSKRSITPVGRRYGQLLQEPQLDAAVTLPSAPLKTRHMLVQPEGVAVLHKDDSYPSAASSSVSGLLMDEGARTDPSQSQAALGEGALGQVPYALGVEGAAAACMCAVEHASRAISALRKNIVPRTSSIEDTLFPSQAFIAAVAESTALGQCICGEVDCLVSQRVGRGQKDRGHLSDTGKRRVCSLVKLLAESYLQLAIALKQDGKVGRSLRAAEIACLVLGGVPYPAPGERASQESSSSQKTKKSQRGKKSENKQAMTKAMKASPAGAEGLPFCQAAGQLLASNQKSFLGQAWALAGEMFVEIAKEASVLGDAATTSPAAEAQSESSMTQRGQNVVPRGIDRIEVQQMQAAAAGLQVHPDVADQLRWIKSDREFWQGDGVLIAGDLEDEAICYACQSARCSCLDERAGMDDEAHEDPCSHLTEEEHTRKHKWPEDTRFDEGVSSSRVGSSRAEDKQATSSQGSGKKSSTQNSSTGKGQSRGTRTGSSDDCDQPTSAAACFGQPLCLDKSSALASAAQLYSRASAAFSAAGDSSSSADALRKEAWCYNELGRHQLQGSYSTAEDSFMKAIDAFRRAGDVSNSVFTLCNLGHGERAQAEAMLASVPSTRSQKSKTIQIAQQVKLAYAAALKWYIDARNELLKHDEQAAKRFPGPWIEVNKQLGNTYLRIGTFLCEWQEVQEGENSGKTGDDLTGLEALTKALVLYETLGANCSQEAAYARYQLALGHSKEARKFRALGNKEALSRHVSIAEANWRKALEVYSDDKYLDMFIRITVERARLSLEVHSGSQLEVLFEALKMLREVVSRLIKNAEPQESAAAAAIADGTISAFRDLLQQVLKDSVALSARRNLKPEDTGVEQDSVCLSDKPERSAFFNRTVWKEAYKLALRLKAFSREELSTMLDAMNTSGLSCSR